MTDGRNLTVRLDGSDHEALQELADGKGRTLASYVRDVLKRHVRSRNR